MLRDDFATCPRCNRALDAAAGCLQCGECHGALYTAQALYDRISESQIQALLTTKRKTPWAREQFAAALALEASRDGAHQLGCPQCGALMTKHALYEVEVDHCHAHGVWLDGTNELLQVLANAAARI